MSSQPLLSAADQDGNAETDEERVPGRRHGGLVRRLLLAVSIAFVVVVGWTAWPEVVGAFDVLGTLALPLMVAATVLQVGAVLALPQVYRAAVSAVGSPITYAQGLQVSMGAFTLSRVLPGGGAAGAVWAARRLQRFGIPWATAGTSVVLEGVLAMATLGVVVALGTVAALFRGRVDAGSVLVAAVIAGLFALAGWAAVALLHSASARGAMFRVAARIVPAARDRLRAWHDATTGLADSLPGARQLRPVVAWSAANWLLEIAGLWIVFVGLGMRMEVGVLVVGYGVANLVTALPHTPGGLGLVEAGMTGAYVALGVETSVALAGVLAYRLISFWLPVLFGIPQYLRAPVAGNGTAP